MGPLGELYIEVCIEVVTKSFESFEFLLITRMAALSAK